MIPARPQSCSAFKTPAPLYDSREEALLTLQSRDDALERAEALDQHLLTLPETEFESLDRAIDLSIDGSVD